MADVLTLADALVTEIAAAFAGASVTADVTREYEIQYDLGKFTGLKVHVFPTAYLTPESATRAEDYVDAECVVVTAERYTANGKPTKAWLDTRVGYVDQYIFDLVRQIEQPLVGGSFWNRRADVACVFDLKMLRQHKVFWSEVEVTYRRLRS